MAPKVPEPLHHVRFNEKGKKSDDGNGDDDFDDGDATLCGVTYNQKRWSLPFLKYIEQPGSITSAALISGLPDVAKLCFRSIAIATVTLYILNQKHMLPMPVGRVVSKVLFWPTIPITISRRIGKWTTEVDNSVIIGGAPFGFMKYPEKLAKQFGVRGVVNMCDEYHGPISSYKRLGIEQLRLPTVDHFEPSVDDLKKAVAFIQKHEARGGRVYVHCRAGHGRSAAAVFAWLMYKEPLADLVDLNQKFCVMRNVRKSLWKQPNINAFNEWLQSGGMEESSDGEESDSSFYEDIKSQRNKRSNDITRQTTSRRSQKDKKKEKPDKFVIDHLGPVFSDEEVATDDYDSDGFEMNGQHYDASFSEDERDYKMWKKYNSD
jgi:atypical dual specificity phosphatase